jgi:ketosteroid isomerase-like protein
MSTDAAIKRIFDDWHLATVSGDLDVLAGLYATDAVFESPTSILTLGQSKGIMKGRAEIRAFFETVYSKISSSTNQWYRTGTYFSDGHQLVWEYPRETPDGDQADILEVMEIKDGFITHHRVYWGWNGLRALLAARG